MLEFLFCPQHGIFRPDNIAILMAYGSSLWLEAQLLYVRFAMLIGRLT